MARGVTWSDSYLEALVTKWLETPGVSSSDFVAAHAPDLPARTLRHHARRKMAEQRAELQRLRAASEKAKPTGSAAPRPDSAPGQPVCQLANPSRPIEQFWPEVAPPEDLGAATVSVAA